MKNSRNHLLGIISPSAPISYSHEKTMRLQRLQQAEENLLARSFGSCRGQHIFACRGWEAGTHAQQLEDIQDFYRRGDITALVATRGGRSSNALLPELDYEQISVTAKPLVGFSDITALLNGIYARTGIVQIHGPMMTAGLELSDELTWQSFQAALEQRDQEFVIETFGEVWRTGQFSGTLLGGNLATIQCLIGTPFEPEWDGSVLFWEEIGEQISKIARIFYHMKNRDILGRISGMIIGELTGVTGDSEEEKARAEEIKEVLLELCSPYAFPVVKTSLFGHGVDTQLSLPVGGLCEFDGRVVQLRSCS